MSMENSVHYNLEADEEWDAAGWRGGIEPPLLLNSQNQSYTISMAHQLRCLDIIRSSLVRFRSAVDMSEPSALTAHCMNYLRQMVLCRSDVTLESARDPVGPNIAVSDVSHVCRDWSVVWEKLRGNVAVGKSEFVTI